MEIAITDLFAVVSAVATPIGAYTGYVHRRISKAEKESREGLDKRVLKEDYTEDMRDVKEMMKEMRGDIKAILGVPQ